MGMHIKKKLLCELVIPLGFMAVAWPQQYNISIFENQIKHDFHINIHSHQCQFREGWGGWECGEGVVYIFCIDLPKSAPAANQPPFFSFSSVSPLKGRKKDRKELDCFSLSLLFHYEYSIFIQLGNRLFNSSKVILRR